MTSQEPSPATIAEIDRRAALLRADVTDFAAMDALWRAVYALDQWFFVARGTRESFEVVTGELPEGRVLLAFTSAQRAHDARTMIGVPPDEESLQLGVPMPAAIDWAAQFRDHGVFGILFDHPVQWYYAALDNLVPMREWMATHPPSA